MRSILPNISPSIMAAVMSLNLAALAACGGATAPEGRQAFPNDVGRRWRYAVYDSLDTRLDTATVSITGTIGLPGLPENPPAYGTLWVVELRGRRDSLIVRENGADFTMTSFSDAPRLFDWLRFPLVVGTWWNGESSGWTDSVTTSSLLAIPGSSRTVVTFTVLTRWASPSFASARYEIELVPGVGMIAMSYRDEGHIAVMRSQYWRLIDPPIEAWQNP
jgi:hypothetical protein